TLRMTVLKGVVVRCTCFVVRCTCFVVRCRCFVVCCTCFVVRCTCFVVRCTCFVVRCTCFVVRWGGSVAQDDGVLGEFGDGGDEAVGFVEDELFEERLFLSEGLRGWHGLGSVGVLRLRATRSAQDDSGLFAGQKRVEDLEVVEEFAGAAEVEVVGGDAAEDLRGGGESGGAVLDNGEFEGLGGIEG